MYYSIVSSSCPKICSSPAKKLWLVTCLSWHDILTFSL